MADPNPPPDSASGSRDPSALRRQAEAARAAHAPEDAPPATSSAASLALRFGGEFGAAILVGAGLGYGADYWLHSSPWGLLLGLGFGFAAGVVNVVRLARATADAVPANPDAQPVRDDDED